MSRPSGAGDGGRKEEEPLFLGWGTYWLSGPTPLWLELEPGGTVCIKRWVWSLQNDSVVAGGGAIEMELSKYLRDYSRTIPGKQQLLIGAYAKALEIIPRQLCDNAGFDATNILNKLRARHAQVGLSSGSRDWVDGVDSECAVLVPTRLSPGDRAGTKRSTN